MRAPRSFRRFQDDYQVPTTQDEHLPTPEPGVQCNGAVGLGSSAKDAITPRAHGSIAT
jgi:hypothetical protein